MGPLLDFMRTYPSVNDSPRAGVLYHAMGILGMIGSPAAIPVLVEVVRRYPDEYRGGGGAGPGGVREPTRSSRPWNWSVIPQIKGYPRRNAIEAARHAAGSDTDDAGAPRRSASSDAGRCHGTHPRGGPEVCRGTGRGGRRRGRGSRAGSSRVSKPPERSREDDAIDEEALDDVTEEESSDAGRRRGEPPGHERAEPYEEVMFLVGDLASLADPESRGMIKTAFAESLVDNFWIDEKSVEEQFATGATNPDAAARLARGVPREVRAALNALNRPPTPLRPLSQPLRPTTDEELSTRRTPLCRRRSRSATPAPSSGRNDPCWCGSGKKYKKCHWGKPGALTGPATCGTVPAGIRNRPREGTPRRSRPAGRSGCRGSWHKPRR